MRFYQDKLTIDPDYADVLRRSGLASVSAILQCLGDRVAAWSRSSDTVEVSVSPDCSVFVKRYHYHTWRHVFRGLLRGTLIGPSRADVEFAALKRMYSAGIKVVRPVACGGRRTLGLLRSCFLVTESVAGATDLLDYVHMRHSDERTRQHLAQRRKLIATLAGQVRRMHDAGFVHGALFWRNVLVRETAERQHEFYFLDTVSRRPTRSPSRAARDVACLMTLAPQFLSRTDCMRFAKSYLQVRRLDAAGRRWIAAVVDVAEPLREHELYRLGLHVRRGRGAPARQGGQLTPQPDFGRVQQ